MEARTGIEPVYAALQAAASPLCHLAGTMRWAGVYTIARRLAGPCPGTEDGSDHRWFATRDRHQRRIDVRVKFFYGLCCLTRVLEAGDVEQGVAFVHQRQH